MKSVSTYSGSFRLSRTRKYVNITRYAHVRSFPHSGAGPPPKPSLGRGIVEGDAGEAGDARMLHSQAEIRWVWVKIKSPGDRWF